MLSINKKKHTGNAIVISWPETKCKQAGAWYEPLMKFTGFNKNGYYKVGHSAIVLIGDQSKECHYFDFGRYHSPHGHGRIRDQHTDHDLTIKTKAQISESGALINKKEILNELFYNRSCHGSGYIFAAITRVNFKKAKAFIKRQQKRGFLSYGPFVSKGSNCSRFVASVLNHSDLSFQKLLKINCQISISASPVGNVKAIQQEPILIGKSQYDQSPQFVDEQVLIPA